METDEFTRLVQAALLDDDGKPALEKDVQQTIQAILKTLSENLQPQLVRQLAATLPPGIGQNLVQTTTHKHTTLNEFFYNVAAREGTTLPRAIHHSRSVIAVLQESVPPEVLQSVWEDLPVEFSPLFQ